MADTFAEKRKEFLSTRRRAFMESAAKVLADRGIHQAKMNDIATEAGVAKVVLYRYFGSKEKLVHEILESIVNDILAADAAGELWWTKRVRNTLHVVRNNKYATILLMRDAMHDQTFNAHYARLEAAIAKRTEERVGSVLKDETPITGATEFLSKTMTTFFLTSYLNWLELDEDGDDEEFFTWITQSVRAMSFYWHKADPTET